MSTFFHDVASAALPVAIVLLLLAVAARAAVWQRIGGAEERFARTYLEPLALWCLGALAVHVLAVGAAGEAGVVSVGVPVVLGVVAALLHPAGAAVARDALEADERPPAAGPARPASVRVPAAPAPAEPAAPTAAAGPRAPDPGGALWADGDDDDRPRSTGLWSRA